MVCMDGWAQETDANKRKVNTIAYLKLRPGELKRNINKTKVKEKATSLHWFK